VPFDSKWIIELVKAQYPEKLEIIERLKTCKAGYWKSKAYIYFVSATNPNQLKSNWQHKESLILEDEKKGTIVIDILTENKIGGIEFLSCIEN
jgi:hypothetical protein